MKLSQLSFWLTAYSLTPTLAASIPATFDFTTSSNADANITLPLSSPLNLTLPLNLSLENSSSSRLPPDPYYYTCPGSSTVPEVIIKFFAYGGAISKSDTGEVLERAVAATSTHPGQINIRTRVLKYTSNNVALIIHCKRLLTWGMLESVERGIWDFVNRYEYVDFDFDVGAPGYWKENVYGTGALTFTKAALSES